MIFDKTQAIGCITLHVSSIISYFLMFQLITQDQHDFPEVTNPSHDNALNKRLMNSSIVFSMLLHFFTATVSVVQPLNLDIHLHFGLFLVCDVTVHVNVVEVNQNTMARLKHKCSVSAAFLYLKESERGITRWICWICFLVTGFSH